MLMSYDLADPKSYDVNTLEEWDEIQYRLQKRIATFNGVLGAKLEAHHMRVAADGLGFLMHLGYPLNICENIKSALLIHDIGKTHKDYNPEIWTLPNRPTQDERAEKRLHTRRGVEILDDVLNGTIFEDHPHATLCKSVILYHHERLNGSLYENRKDLPRWLQAICIIDTYDGDRIQRPHHDHRRSPTETIERMMAELDDGDKYEGAFDHDLLEDFAAYKL